MCFEEEMHDGAGESSSVTMKNYANYKSAKRAAKRIANTSDYPQYVWKDGHTWRVETRFTEKLSPPPPGAELIEPRGPWIPYVWHLPLFVSFWSMFAGVVVGLSLTHALWLAGWSAAVAIFVRHSSERS